MDVLRTVSIGLAYALWVFGGLFLVSSVFSGFGTALFTAVGLIVLGGVFFGLNKMMKRR